jgi:hypothetical protein
MTVRSFHSHTQRNYVRVVSKLAAFSWPLARAAGRRICGASFFTLMIKSPRRSGALRPDHNDDADNLSVQHNEIT